MKQTIPAHYPAPTTVKGKLPAWPSYYPAFDTNAGGGAEAGGSAGPDVSALTKKLEELEKKFEQTTKSYDKRLKESEDARKEYEQMLIEAAGGEEAVNYFIEHGRLPEEADGGGENKGVSVEGLEGIEGAENVDALMRGVTEKFNRRVVALEKELAREREVREQAEAERLNQQRDSQLVEALTANDVIDVKAGLKLMRDQAEYDEEAQRWKFKGDDGIYYDIGQGVANALPDYMRKAMVPGGSGSRGSSQSTPSAVQQQIDRKRTQLVEFQKAAQKSGDHRNIDQYQRAKRELAELESQASAVRR